MKRIILQGEENNIILAIQRLREMNLDFEIVESNSYKSKRWERLKQYEEFFKHNDEVYSLYDLMQTFKTERKTTYNDIMHLVDKGIIYYDVINMTGQKIAIISTDKDFKKLFKKRTNK